MLVTITFIGQITNFATGEGTLGVILSHFGACLLHQMSRILVHNLERQQVAASLYSLTGLCQHTLLRTKTWEALQAVLKEEMTCNHCEGGGNFFRSPEVAA